MIRLLRDIEPELTLLVIVLRKVKQNRRRLEDIEVSSEAVSKGRNATIRVELDEPEDVQR